MLSVSLKLLLLLLTLKAAPLGLTLATVLSQRLYLD